MIHTSKYIFFVFFCFSCASSLKFSTQPQIDIYGQKYPDYHYLIAEISSLEGQTQKSIDSFNNVLKNSPANIVHFRLAQEYLKQGLIDQAQTECEKFIAQSPTSNKQTKGYLLLAGIHTSMNQLELALKQYENILKINKNNKSALLQYVLLMEEFNRPVSDSILQKLAHQTEFHQHKGNLYLSQGKEQKAIHSFKKALELEPSNRMAALRLFQIYGYKNQYHLLTQFMEKTDFQDTYIASLMARAYLRQGKQDKMLEKLEDLLLDHPVIHNL
ncbi:MAG: tetratricopeptide repeat protein [Bdellovibrionales bacterium]|nr:tetratricopeptide repeat protein [Bdellovibrionales bacterium]